MGKLKEFMSSPKKTAILGLVGGIIMLLFTILAEYIFYIDYDYINIYSLIYNLFILGVITYFVVVLLRISKHNVSINIANSILITTFILSLLGGIYIGISQGEGIILFDFLLFISILYFCNILFRKLNLINNKVFVIVVISSLMFNLIMNVLYILESSEITFGDLTNFIITPIRNMGYILTLPYFYNYYELLKEEK